jgi:hypothetical protein
VSNVPEILPDFENEDEQIHEMNEFVFWHMPNDPDDDDDDDNLKNKRNSAHSMSMFTKRKQ